MRLITLTLLFLSGVAYGQSIVGRWKTVDDETGKERSIVEIFERDGKVFGKVVRIFSEEGEEADPRCKECPEDDDRYNKKVIGMEIIRDMKSYGTYYSDGEILDPKIGKIYRCKLWIEDSNLKVRGFWGPFYRTQTWIKIS
jgi:uncharacterized protein (DUF2147 family)